MSVRYIICSGEKMLTLKKGMTIEDVKSLLGEPIETQKCDCPSNLKYLYKLKNSSIINHYVILFNAGLVAYVAKTN